MTMPTFGKKSKASEAEDAAKEAKPLIKDNTTAKPRKLKQVGANPLPSPPLYWSGAVWGARWRSAPLPTAPLGGPTWLGCLCDNTFDNMQRQNGKCKTAIPNVTWASGASIGQGNARRQYPM